MKRAPKGYEGIQKCNIKARKRKEIGTERGSICALFITRDNHSLPCNTIVGKRKEITAGWAINNGIVLSTNTIKKIQGSEYPCNICKREVDKFE